tara:strand:+ start:124 stop:921 length:798 start_codon:yes stop_codon:yes gene_type:complete
MKRYLVIGNPIKHSLSPKLHNYWIKENNIEAIYEKKQLEEADIKKTILEIKNGEIEGINVTIPFKKSIIPYLDETTALAKETQSVNTIYKKEGKIIGHNTDVGGFKHALEHIGYNVKGKKIFILGAGGVAPSIVSALKTMGSSEISISNRTKEKAENLKKIYSDLKVINWGDNTNFDMIINATSLGLKKDDEIKLNYSDIGPNKFFYDIIYNPRMTKFLEKAKEFSNQIQNGKHMFVYQAQLSFEIWHGIKPKMDKKALELLDND